VPAAEFPLNRCFSVVIVEHVAGCMPNVCPIARVRAAEELDGPAISATTRAPVTSARDTCIRGIAVPQVSVVGALEFVPLREPAKLVPDFRFDTSASTNLASTGLGACPSSARSRERGAGRQDARAVARAGVRPGLAPSAPLARRPDRGKMSVRDGGDEGWLGPLRHGRTTSEAASTGFTSGTPVSSSV
jgi:hypothetical protein